MLKATAILIVLLLGSGCVTTYHDADAEPATHPLMGLRCEHRYCRRLVYRAPNGH